jgi:NAD(P)-dependent dehydrogenase (short-subunit alcohol dehydrogenase family)
VNSCWFITGVGSGLGRATAAAALARGDTVAGLLRDPNAAAAFEALAPGRALPYVADVRNRDAVFEAVAQVEGRTRGIDILVNNAGRVLESLVEDAEPGAVRELFEVNLLGTINCIQALLPHFRVRRRGRIVNISSGGGIVGVPAIGLYCASKFAVEGLSEALAQEVKPFGIGVTIVEPGAFRTNLLTHSRTVIASRIADYDASVGAFRAWLGTMGGRERGDPARLAEAMLALADSPTPPMRLPLGDDAIGMVEQKAASLLADVGNWRSVGTGLGFSDGV